MDALERLELLRKKEASERAERIKSLTNSQARNTISSSTGEKNPDVLDEIENSQTSSDEALKYLFGKVSPEPKIDRDKETKQYYNNLDDAYSSYDAKYKESIEKNLLAEDIESAKSKYEKIAGEGSERHDGKSWDKVEPEVAKKETEFVKDIVNYAPKIEQLYDIVSAKQRIMDGHETEKDMAVLKRYAEYKNLNKDVWFAVAETAFKALPIAKKFGIDGLITQEAINVEPGQVYESLYWLDSKNGKRILEKKFEEYGLNDATTKISSHAAYGLHQDTFSAYTALDKASALKPNRIELSEDARHYDMLYENSLSTELRDSYNSYPANNKDPFLGILEGKYIDNAIVSMRRYNNALKDLQITDKILKASYVNAFKKMNPEADVSAITDIGWEKIADNMNKGVASDGIYKYPLQEQLVSEFVKYSMNEPGMTKDVPAKATQLIMGGKEAQARRLLKEYRGDLPDYTFFDLYKPTDVNFGESLISGAFEVIGGIAGTPRLALNTAYWLAGQPLNFIYDLIGKPEWKTTTMEKQFPKYKEAAEFLLPAEKSREIADKYSQSQEFEGDILSYAKAGKWGEVGKLIGVNVVENLPQQAVIYGSAAVTGGASLGITIISAGAAAQKYDTLDKYNSELSEGIKLLNAIASGGIEYYTETYLGTGKIIGRILDNPAAKEGAQAGIKLIAKEIARGAYEEGLKEEGTATILETVLDILTGVETTPTMRKFIAEYVTSILTGTVTGGLLAGGGTTVNVISAKAEAKSQRNQYYNPPEITTEEQFNDYPVGVPFKVNGISMIKNENGNPEYLLLKAENAEEADRMSPGTYYMLDGQMHYKDVDGNDFLSGKLDIEAIERGMKKVKESEAGAPSETEGEYEAYKPPKQISVKEEAQKYEEATGLDEESFKKDVQESYESAEDVQTVSKKEMAPQDHMAETASIVNRNAVNKLREPQSADRATHVGLDGELIATESPEGIGEAFDIDGNQIGYGRFEGKPGQEELSWLDMGGIAIDAGLGIVKIMRKPNKRQQDSLRRIFKKHGEYSVDIIDTDGNTVQSVEYNEESNPSDALRDINAYFEKGVEVEEAPAREITEEVEKEVEQIGEEQAIENARAEIAEKAQKVIDDFFKDEENVTCEAGACDEVSNAIAGVLTDLGYNVLPGGQEGSDHAFPIAIKGNKAYSVDIPPSVYEEGVGYKWSKKEGAKISPVDIIIQEISIEDIGPEAFEEAGLEYPIETKREQPSEQEIGGKTDINKIILTDSFSSEYDLYEAVNSKDSKVKDGYYAAPGYGNEDADNVYLVKDGYVTLLPDVIAEYTWKPGDEKTKDVKDVNNHYTLKNIEKRKLPKKYLPKSELDKIGEKGIKDWNNAVKELGLVENNEKWYGHPMGDYLGHRLTSDDGNTVMYIDTHEFDRPGTYGGEDPIYDGLQINLLMTKPGERGKGGARDLLRKVTSWADRNKTDLYLQVAEQDKTTEFDRLKKFYESEGFIFNDDSGLREARPNLLGKNREESLKVLEDLKQKSLSGKGDSSTWFDPETGESWPATEKGYYASSINTRGNSDVKVAVSEGVNEMSGKPFIVGIFNDPADKIVAVDVTKVFDNIIDAVYYANANDQNSVYNSITDTIIERKDYKYILGDELFNKSEAERIKNLQAKGEGLVPLTPIQKSAAITSAKAEAAQNTDPGEQSAIAAATSVINESNKDEAVPGVVLANETIKQLKGISGYKQIPADTDAPAFDYNSEYTEAASFTAEDMEDPDKLNKVYKILAVPAKTPEQALQQEELYRNTIGKNKKIKIHKRLTTWEQIKAMTEDWTQTAGAAVSGFARQITDRGRIMEYKRGYIPAIFVNECIPFLTRIKTLYKSDYNKSNSIVRALWNENEELAKDMIIKFMGEEAISDFERARLAFDAAYEYAKTVYPNLNRRDFYFPRYVSDYIGLRKAYYQHLMRDLGYSEVEVQGINNIFEAKIAVLEKQRKGSLSDIEKAMIFESYLRNDVLTAERTGLPGSSHTKARVIENITADMMQYYYPLDKAIESYFTSIVTAVEARKMIYGTYYSMRSGNVPAEVSVEDIEQKYEEGYRPLLNELKAEYNVNPIMVEYIMFNLMNGATGNAEILIKNYIGPEAHEKFKQARHAFNVANREINEQKIRAERTEDISKIFDRPYDVDNLMDNYENAIGKIMTALTAETSFSEYQWDRIETYLKTLFDRKRLGNIGSFIVNSSYITLLSQFPKAGIRQIGDLGTVMMLNGALRSAKIVGKVLKEKISQKFVQEAIAEANKILMTDVNSVIGDISIMEKVARDSGADINKVTDFLLKVSGLSLVDSFFTQCLIEGHAENLMKIFKTVNIEKINDENEIITIEVGKNRVISLPLDGKSVANGYGLKAYRASKVVQEMKSILGKSFEQVAEAVKRGDFSSMGAQSLLYSQMAKARPIGISEQPSKKTRGKTTKLLYTLKTFSLKLINVWREQVFREINDGIKNGNKAQVVNGLVAGSKFMLYFTMANAAGNFLIDFIMNRDLDPEDIFLDAFLELFAVNRWQGYMLTEGIKRGTSPQEAIFKVIAPPIWNISIDTYKSVRRVIKGDEKLAQADFYRFVPVVGSLYHAWLSETAIKYGRNPNLAIKYRKWLRQQSKGKKRKPTTNRNIYK